MLKYRRKSVFLIVFALFCVMSLGAVSAADVPSASFTSDVVNGTVPLSVHFNDASSGSPTSWYWNFGDGSNSTEQNPVHDYTKAGRYSVSLLASNGAGSDIVSRANYVRVFSSAAKNRFNNSGFETGNMSGWTAGTTVNISSAMRHGGLYGVHFAAGSESTGFLEQDVDLTLVDSFSFWGYGEGNTQPFKVFIDGSFVKMLYATSNTWTQYTVNTSSYTGNHSIKISWLVNSACFDVDDFSTSISKNQANFTSKTVNDNNSPLTAQFNDTSIGLITDWLWDFGDGATSTDENPVHVYTKPGTYTVKLTVSGPYYNSTKTVSDLFTVIGPTNTRTGKVYSTIQAAIDDAQNGDTIRIGSTSYLETYMENLSVNKRVNLIAQGNVIITALDVNNPVFNILSGGSGSLIDGFTITGATNSNGIYIAPLVKATIIHNTFKNNKIGIDVYGNATITDNTITDNNIGINVSSNATITSNTVTGNDIGINVDHGTASIHFNNIYDNELYGLKFTGDDLYASNNWWGNNNPTYKKGTTAPGKVDIYEAQNASHLVYDPWIVLKITSSDNLLKKGDTSKITVDMTHNSDNQDTSSSGSIPNLPVYFHYTLGTLTTTSTTVSKGKASAVLTGAKTSGTANLTATVTGCAVGISITVDTIPPNASASLSSGVYKTTQKVKLSTDSTAVIYYTTDKSNPLNSSTRIKYTGTITISKSTSLRFAAVDPTGNWSSLYIMNYVIGTGGLANSPWPGFQNDKNRSGQSGYVGPLKGMVKWIYNNVTMYGSPVIGSDGTIYVGGADGKLYVFSSNGTLKWTYGTRSSIFGSPTIGLDGTIYLSNWMDSTLYALSLKGKLLWKRVIGNYNFGSSPAIGADGTIYIPTTNDTIGKLCAINPNGTVKWTYTTGIIYGSSPVIGKDGTIYLTDYNGIFYAINADGTLKWSLEIKNTRMYYNTPSIGPDGTVYIVNYNSISNVWLTPYIKKEKVGADNSSLFAISDNGTIGSVKWSYKMGEMLYGAPAVSSNGTVYVIGYSKLYAINSNGHLLWAYDKDVVADNGLTSAVIDGDGTVYFGCSTGLYAVNPNGSLKWSYATTGGISGSPAIGSDGILYIGTVTGFFYAFGNVITDLSAVHVDHTALTIQFTDKSTGTVKSWYWTFGDGKNSTLHNPAHVYSKAGNYIVTLTVTLMDGSKVTGARVVTVKEFDVTAPIVSSNPSGGVFKKPQNVTLKFTDNSGKATVYYTLDSTDPRTSSTRMVYTSPIEIWDTMTLKFAAIDPSGNWSKVYSEKYTIQHTIYIQDASYYTNGTLSSQIQSILDKAESGSTIVFLGKAYENLQLTINKQLNIISNVATKISNSSTVFLITGSKASGTNISGFTIISDSNSGILVNNTNNVIISGDKVSSTNGTAILITDSYNTTIKNSSIIDSITGLAVTLSIKTNIIGNTITDNRKFGVNLENSPNTTINGGIISDNVECGVRIYNSDGTVVNGVSITKNGLSGASSSRSGVYIQDSNNVKVINSQIIQNWYGVITNNTIKATIISNTITDNTWDGVLLIGDVINTTISSNYLQRNNNGIQINGAYKNLLIEANIITNNQYREGDDGYHSGDGIVFGWGSNGSSSLLVNHNIIVQNVHRDIETRYGWVPTEGEYNYIPGRNWIDSYCCADKYDPWMELKLIRTGPNTYMVWLYDPVEKKRVTGIPSFSIDVSFGPSEQTLMTEDTKVTVTYGFNSLMGMLTAKTYGRSVSLPWNTQISGETYIPKTDTGYASGSSGNGGNGNGNGGSGNGNGNGGNGNGNGNGNGSGSGTSSGTSSLGLAMAAAAGGSSSAGSSGSSGKDKTVQELIVDEVKKPQVWGIIVIIVLILLVFGAYYRTDLKNMIKKSKK